MESIDRDQHNRKSAMGGDDYPVHSPLSLIPFSSVDLFLKSQQPQMDLVGTVNPTAISLFIGHFLAKFQPNSPQLVVCSSDKEAGLVEKSLQFSNPDLNIHVLKGFDVSPYSHLYPNTRTIAERIDWLHRASHAKPGDVFIAPVMSLLQRTLPYSVLNENSFSYRKDDDLPSDLHEFLTGLGYSSVPLVEDVGTYSFRGGILDVYSPAHKLPIRIELFGDTIDTIRTFNVSDQRSLESVSRFELLPTREILFDDENQQRASIHFKKSLEGREYSEDEAQSVSRSLAQGQYFHGVEFLLDYFYESFETPLDYFSEKMVSWFVDPVQVAQAYDNERATLKKEYELNEESALNPDHMGLYRALEDLEFPEDSRRVNFSTIHVQDGPVQQDLSQWTVSNLSELTTNRPTDEKQQVAIQKIMSWKKAEHAVFLASPNKSMIERLILFAEKTTLNTELVSGNDYDFSRWVADQKSDESLIHIIPRELVAPLRLADEKVVFLRDEEVFGKKIGRRQTKTTGSLKERSQALSFGDLKEDDFIVHKLHGIGIYKGLLSMPINGVDSEFINIEYKGKDKLYVPIYRIGQIQKYSGPSSPQLIDKLGGTSWAKTQTKVRAHLRDIANELLTLYAKRAQFEKPPFSIPDKDFLDFESSFPFDETEDQMKAINDVVSDLTSGKPMDRLVCGDVGFGKTEVAMRAAFKVAQDRKQVAIIAPTTVLTFQHLQTFTKRFSGWPLTIKALNRFVSKPEQKKVVQEIKDGKVDIVIGTHRLFSKDIEFKDLGLLIIDEEQKFGVKHKERIRKLKQGVDTLTMSATPIPRTLNLSLMGLRDLSLINTAPVDRLPTRTFVCKFDRETIRKAVMSEVERGGQVFFLHNRVNSIYSLHEELKDILPGVRMAVGHGQMEEAELEKVMLQFFNHELDVLICTTIIESGMDIPKANTMFIDNAQQLGLSQLYQLRGRVGRSKTRAYCYLMVPKNRKIDKVAQERLKVIQENTALGSGMQIAHYDLELRGAGDILGEDQSGNINAVGYELYLELLEEQIRILKGEELVDDLEPEINIKVKALIPDQYISDIRIRLSYYKHLTQIQSEQDLDRFEEELRDQFGTPPEPVLNLMGVMLIRAFCQRLKIKDLSQGKVGVSLMFTEKTPLSVDKVLKLTQRADGKYSLTPDNRLIVRMKEVSWPRIFDELQYIDSLCPKKN